MDKIILETFIKRGLSDRRERILRFTEKGIEFDNSTFFVENTEFIEYNQIKSYRFGLEWITGLYFTFGREYIIELKTIDNRIIKLNSSCYYGFKKNELAKKQNEILDALWENYSEKKCLDNLEKYKSQMDFTILKTKITSNGVHIKNTLVEWNNIEIKEYFDYFVIFSSKDVENLNQAYYYKLDWDSGILFGTIKTIKNSS
ncbi:hypothetical protein [uncultured Tenacibaculum sp.]|uniref:hypothetical protein n=1 Tax=uncultured Tenacibaculum sp. TaxID=174713 RepID=UPI00262FDBCF|nr:hypothetical protein [uncultured Tenacibaculum sp.]